MLRRFYVTVALLLITMAAPDAQVLQPATSVGMSEGTFGVSATGQGTYALPLWAPGGLAGIQPSLALTYNSNRGDGSLGPGWAISGLPRIARCPRTFAQDGTPNAVRLTYTDAYCFDGAHLRNTSVLPDGADGSTYQAELADFSLITAKGTQGAGPAWFEMRAKNGLIYEFGNSSDSRATLPGVSGATPYAWALNKIRDRRGNELIVTYIQSSSVMLPSTVRYTKTAGGADYPYGISFTYTPRGLYENQSGYLSGSKLGIDSFLTRIDVRHGDVSTGQLLRRYHFDSIRSATTGRILLSAIQECAGATGADCMRPTRFRYQAGAPGIGGLISAGSVPVLGSKRFADINGDGKSDLIYEQRSGTTSQWLVRFGGNGGLSASATTGITTTTGQEVLLGDFLGTGKVDLLAPGAGQWRLYSWNGSAFTVRSTGLAVETNLLTAINGHSFAAGDFNGDGRADLAWAALNGNGMRRVYTRLNTSTLFAVSFSTTAVQSNTDVPNPYLTLEGNYSERASQAPRMDFDGDGLDDLLIEFPSISTNTSVRQLITRTNGNFLTGGTLAGQSGAVGALTWNGDACTDLYYGGLVYVSACNGTSGALLNALNAVAFPDWDADGRTDLFGASNVQLSASEQVRPNSPHSLLTSGYTWLGTPDLDGDGLSDAALMHSTSGQLTVAVHNGSGVAPDLLNDIEDGFGNKHQLVYEPIATSASYSNNDGNPAPVYPRASYAEPYFVVKYVDVPDGRAGVFRQQYFYWGARADVQGRGFLGFAKRRMTDNRTGTLHYEEYRQDFPFTGALAKAYVRQPNDSTPISSVDNSYSSIALNSVAFNRRDFIFLSQSVTKSYGVGGASNGAHLSTSTSTNSFDAWGTLTDQVTNTVQITGADAGASHTRRTYHPAVTNDVANWCLSKPERSELAASHTLTGGSSLLRVSEYTWDFVNCRLTQEIDEPGDAQWQMITDYQFDAFGNASNVTVTPPTGQGQLARTTTLNWGIDGRYLRTLTNARNQTTTLDWNVVAGTLSSVTDVNGKVTERGYDSFNRLMRNDAVDGTAVEYALSYCAPGCGVAADLRVLRTVTARNTANAIIRTSSEYLDGFGRPRFQYEQMLSGGNAITETVYDAFGRVATQSMPYAQGGPVWRSSITYDLLGRPLLIRRPSSEADSSNHDTSFSYDGFEVVQTDALGHGSTTRRNAVGQIRAVVDAATNATSYDYDAFGNLTRTVDPHGNAIVLTYNALGMKLSSDDPDMGLWTYEYYPFGELRRQLDPKAQVLTFTYDVLSRPLTRIEQEGTTNWTWDTAANGIGQLASVTSPGGYGESYTYDTFGRMQTQSTIIDGATYSYTAGYDAGTGLLQTLTYPGSIGTPLRVQYDYQYGQLLRVKDFNSPSTVFWEAFATDASQRVIDFQLGNGLRTNRTYDRINGMLDRIDTGPTGSSTAQQLVYIWDKVGNLLQREDLNQGSLLETFEYDTLDRLVTTRRNGVTTLNLTYDAIGNITSRSDVGSYSYDPVKKHAVTAAGSHTYIYDANGNAMWRDGRATTWYSYNMPRQIVGDGSRYARFYYGAHRQRYKQEHHAYAPANTALRTTLYAGGLFERTTDTLTGVTQTLYRHYIEANGERVASHVRQSRTQTSGTTTANWTDYAMADHLGSMDALYRQTSSASTLIARYSFDAFGSRRDRDWDGAPTAADSQRTWEGFSNRGFTGHEHLDNLDGLIHMNGRVYDSVIARFMSPDPMIQAPQFSQSFNRYSYTYNNPLKYIDPSGFACGTIVGPSGTIPDQVCNYPDDPFPSPWPPYNPGYPDSPGYPGYPGNPDPTPQPPTEQPPVDTPSSFPAASAAWNGPPLLPSNRSLFTSPFGLTAAGTVGGNSVGDWSVAAVGAAGRYVGSYGPTIASSTAVRSALVVGAGTSVADGPLPAGEVIGGTIILAVTAGVVVDRAADDIAGLVESTRTWAQRPGEVYTLRALAPGLYPDLLGGGLSYLNAGDIWKVGESINGAGRYSSRFYSALGIGYQTEYVGGQLQIKIMEKQFLARYVLEYGRLPPGNLIFR